MNTETEKLYTELRIAQKEEELAASNKRTKIDTVKKHLLIKFQELLTAHAGQKFAIIIEGVFNKIEALGVLEHKMRITSFNKVFMGIINNDPVLQNPEVSSLAGQHSPFPAQKIIKGAMRPELAKPEEKLYLQFSPRNEASWYLDDFLVALTPDDVKNILAPRKYQKNETWTKVTLWIGNAKFEEYLKTRDYFAQQDIADLLP